MTKVYDNATDLITFARSSSGTALRRVGYGDEIFGDPSFDGTGDWSLAFGSVTVSGGKLTYDAVDNVRGAEQNVNIYAGKVYQVSFEVLSGTARLFLSTGRYDSASVSNLGGDNYGVGVHQINVVANGDYSTVGFTLSKYLGGTACELAYFSMKEVIFDRPTDPLVLFNHPDDIPRIEYGSDGSLKGLLIEEQRTNLVTYSENFPYLYESSLVFTYGVSSPTGGSNATIFSPTSNTANAISPVNLNLSTGSYTGSMWAKGVGASVGKTFRMWFWHLTSTGDSGIQTFTLTDEWQRFDVTGTVTSTGDTRFRIDVTDHSEDFHVFGLQLEEGSFPTSYIPTSGGQKTRDPDIASIPVSAFGYNQEAGTVVVEASFNGFTPDGPTGYPRVWNLDQASSKYLALISNASKTVNYRDDEWGSEVVALTATEGVAFRAAAAFRDGDAAASGNGGAASTASPVSTLDMPSNLSLGSVAGTRSLNGHIKSIQYYPRRLTDAQLQELTS